MDASMEPSPLLPPLAAGAAVLFVLFQIWRGWRLGVVRGLLNLTALAAAGMCGWFGGRLAAAVSDRFLPWSPVVTGVVFGVLAALVVYAVISVLSAVLFKRTGHQGSGIVRLLYGGGGAVVGLIVGLVFVWGGILAIKAFGTIAETQIARAGPEPGVTGPPASRLAIEIAGLKHAIENSGPGQIVQTVDPLPDEIYTVIFQVSLLSSDDEAMARFMSYPGVEELMQHPRFSALASDPDISNAALRRDMMEILTHPLVLQAISDRDFVEELKKVDVREAMDQALRESGNAEE